MFGRSFRQTELPAVAARSKIREELGHIDEALSEISKRRQPYVAEDLYLMRHQLAIERLSGEECPIVHIAEEWIPILEYEFNVNVWETSVDRIEVKRVEGATRRGAGQLKVSRAPVADIPGLMLQPLAYFLGARFFGSPPPPSGGAAWRSSGSAASNVEVHNNENGWQVIYSPIYLSQQNGLGGPSTPVKGYVPPGTFRFGIAKPAQVLWDTTHWNIPASSAIFVPLP
jgi:hypothetical protein